MTKQKEGIKVLKADSTDWLLQLDYPDVRYLALRDIAETNEYI